MRPELLVDTSIWVDYLRSPSAQGGDHLDGLLRKRRVHTCGIVVAELMQGARSATDAQLLQSSLEALPFHESDRDIHLAAGRLSGNLRSQGISIPITDALIATVAHFNQLGVWTLDSHFSRVPGLSLYKPSL